MVAALALVLAVDVTAADRAAMKQVVSYGGGTNSAAMLVGLWEHGERPDAIVFADTGGEKPHTYRHLHNMMQPWCARVGFPEITIVKGSQPRQIADGSLENECLRLGSLPSKAMGFGACSDKWKRDPFEKWLKAWALGPVLKLVGFGAEETHRVRRASTYSDESERRYPLIEWDWDRRACEAAILRAGLPSPGKSACFFCPSSKTREILELRQKYPDLLARALEIERRAIAGEGPAPALHTAKGLGRGFAWAEFLRQTDAQLTLFTDADVPQQCTDESCFT